MFAKRRYNNDNVTSKSQFNEVFERSGERERKGESFALRRPPCLITNMAKLRRTGS